MNSFLPYAIVVGVVVIFFCICYVLFSGSSTKKKKKRKLLKMEQKGYLDNRGMQNSFQTSPVPRVSQVPIQQREENPQETRFVTTKGEVVRRDGKMVYEEPPATASGTTNREFTRALSRAELLAAMEKVDKEEAASKKAIQEEQKKKTCLQQAAEETNPLDQLGAIVTADLLAKTQSSSSMGEKDDEVDEATQIIQRQDLSKEVPRKETSLLGRRENIMITETSVPASPLVLLTDKQAEQAVAASPFMQEWVQRFIQRFGEGMGERRRLVSSITASAFACVGCQKDAERQQLVASLSVQEALEKVQRVYVTQPYPYVKYMALTAFYDIARGRTISTRPVVAMDALNVMPYLTTPHYQILSILLRFLYLPDQTNVDKETFCSFLDTKVLPFFTNFPMATAYYQQLEHVRCLFRENKETRFAEILANSYPLLFGYRGMTEDELHQALHGKYSPKGWIVPSVYASFFKLALANELGMTKFFRDACIQDRKIQQRLLQLAKKRPVHFSGEEALYIMERISPILSELSDIWDSSPLKVSTLSLLGLYLAQGYIKSEIGETVDISRWVE